MAQPNDETLGITALMIITLQSVSKKATLIDATHSNIITLDISNKFHNLSS